MNGHTLDIPYDEIVRLTGVGEIPYAAGYQINAGFPPEDTPRPDLITEAVETAKNAGIIILFTGYPYGVESEGYDRTDLFLPKSQRELLDAVLEVNTNVILVINTGAPVDITAYNKRVRAVRLCRRGIRRRHGRCVVRSGGTRRAASGNLSLPSGGYAFLSEFPALSGYGAGCGIRRRCVYRVSLV